jgi:hypothetical protein
MTSNSNGKRGQRRPHVYYSPGQGGWTYWTLMDTGASVDGHPMQQAMRPIGKVYPTRAEAFAAAQQH